MFFTKHFVGKNTAEKASDRRYLPHKRHQPVLYFLLIVDIAFESVFQDFFLVAYPCYYYNRVGKEYHKGYHRTKYKRCKAEHKNGGGVHGVAYNAVKPRVDDFLFLLYLHRAGEVFILAEYLGVHGVADEEYHRRSNADPHWKSQPPEAETQPRRDEARKEHQQT